MVNKVFLVDSFTDQPFHGNPAAVVLLTQKQDAKWMQGVAAEMAVSETAFILPGSVKGEYQIEWFTPTKVAELCGHATLAAAHVLWETGTEQPDSQISFTSRSGPLSAQKSDSWIKLDFPTEPAEMISTVPDILVEEFGPAIKFTGMNRIDYFVELESDRAIFEYTPNFSNLEKLGRGVIVTALSSNPLYDFTSRVFAPSEGIPEDPVTGSAHCCLSSYWSTILKKDQLVGYQASPRGGIVRLHHLGSRTLLFGQAISIMKGQLVI